MESIEPIENTIRTILALLDQNDALSNRVSQYLASPDFAHTPRAVYTRIAKLLQTTAGEALNEVPLAELAAQVELIVDFYAHRPPLDTRPLDE